MSISHVPCLWDVLGQNSLTSSRAVYAGNWSKRATILSTGDFIEDDKLLFT